MLAPSIVKEKVFNALIREKCSEIFHTVITNQRKGFQSTYRRIWLYYFYVSLKGTDKWKEHLTVSVHFHSFLSNLSIFVSQFLSLLYRVSFCMLLWGALLESAAEIE